MEAIPANKIITTTGEYKIFECTEGSNVVVEIDGTLDGATVTLGRESITKVFRAYRKADGVTALTMALGDIQLITTGVRGVIALKVENAGAGTSIQFAVTRHKPRFYS